LKGIGIYKCKEDSKIDVKTLEFKWKYVSYKSFC
jgi:hypothetical protein